MLESFGYEAYLVGRPYLPINYGWWDGAYEAAKLNCPPRCTGDVVALRRSWQAREAVARELTSVARVAPHASTRLATSTKGRGHDTRRDRSQLAGESWQSAYDRAKLDSLRKAWG